MVAIGIDLGTTNTVVSVWKKNQAVIIPNQQGQRITPSVVAFTDRDMLVGDEAKKQVNFIKNQHLQNNGSFFMSINR
jgi:molecular chaperone DnaK (HSP70)